MGLDLTVMVEGDIHRNDKDQLEWTTTMIANLRNCWEYMNALGLENCTTRAFSGKELNDALAGLEDNPEDLCEAQRIRDTVTFEDDKTYLLHAWY